MTSMPAALQAHTTAETPTHENHACTSWTAGANPAAPLQQLLRVCRPRRLLMHCLHRCRLHACCAAAAAVPQHPQSSRCCSACRSSCPSSLCCTRLPCLAALQHSMRAGRHARAAAGAAAASAHADAATAAAAALCARHVPVCPQHTRWEVAAHPHRHPRHRLTLGHPSALLLSLCCCRWHAAAAAAGGDGPPP
ncbi:hypothetical protein COO60DRAFT_972237 [Scenedesmus sp. NREL 46B-D3]|nr:hypothetical protein COO60DRAFT_972237 [Scenedesmus sp. NREL 46B-D3]